jgi:hypothetical protein
LVQLLSAGILTNPTTDPTTVTGGEIRFKLCCPDFDKGDCLRLRCLPPFSYYFIPIKIRNIPESSLCFSGPAFDPCQAPFIPLPHHEQAVKQDLASKRQPCVESGLGLLVSRQSSHPVTFVLQQMSPLQ